MIVLTADQRFLLDWLSREDWSAAGECRGQTLDNLIAHGLAEYGPEDRRGADYRGVRLTEAGWGMLRGEDA
jgi:hypothetical protein